MNKNNKTIVALFTYGGGMRGLIPAHIMSYIEKQTGLRMVDMVDIFSGPSTGAILNSALTLAHPEKPGRPKYRARHLVNFYEREGINIFPPDSFRDFRGIVHDFNNRTLKLSQLNALLRHGHYQKKNLGKALSALYGDATISESLKSLIIPVYNIDGQIEAVEESDESDDSPARTKNNFMDRGGHAVWLKNIKTGIPSGIASRAPGVKLYDAVMASCAAPTFFPCHDFEITYPDTGYPLSYTGIDGSIFDNPCISYLGAIRNHIPKDYRLIMIILGTGYTNFSVKKEDWNRYGALGVVDPVNDLPLINIFFHASESALMDSFAEEMGANLFIFNKPITNRNRDGNMPSAQIDDASPGNINALKSFADKIIDENAQQFDYLCGLLTENYEQNRRIDISDTKRNIVARIKNKFTDKKE